MDWRLLSDAGRKRFAHRRATMLSFMAPLR